MAASADNLTHGDLKLTSDSGYAFAFKGGLIWLDEQGAAGQTALTGAVAALPDSMTTLLLVEYKAPGGTGHSYKVIDRRTWDVKMEVPADKVAGIVLGQIGIYDGYLYILNKSDWPVIEITTGKQVSAGWKFRPIQHGDGATIAVQETNDPTNDNRQYSARSNVIETDAESVVPHSDINLEGGIHYMVIPDVNGQFPGPRF
ncbi:hypothetical protein NOVA_29040 [Nocardia nova]|uniref:hypothetical protein n=1 Tax=Nocardia nova TaxID=37330 RepID=UPI001C447486|nr:hypothetical protein [Nocardia nova]MBV7706839.1 hypothetical protein [Nocardia nova]